MKKSFIIVILLFLPHSLHADEKPLSISNAVNGFFIGKVGWVYSTIHMDDGKHHKNANCYQVIKEFELENWRIEFGAPCGSSERIGQWLLKDDLLIVKDFKETLIRLKRFTEYIYNDTVNLDLYVLLIDDDTFYRDSFHSLVINRIPLHTYTAVQTDVLLPEGTLQFRGKLASTVAHELFHLYAIKHIKKKTKKNKRILSNSDNNEALAQIVETCAGFSASVEMFDLGYYEQLKKFYIENKTPEDIYENAKSKKTRKGLFTIDHTKAELGYDYGIYALWDQFGTDIQPYEKNKIADMLKFCRYVVQTIPDVEALREIELSDYLPMPRPGFYLDAE